jgi:excisionase family DNA binding protein
MQTYQPKVKMATIKEAAEIFGLSQDYVRKLALHGKVRAVRVGNAKILVDLIDLEKYLVNSLLDGKAHWSDRC